MSSRKNFFNPLMLTSRNRVPQAPHAQVQSVNKQVEFLRRQSVSLLKMHEADSESNDESGSNLSKAKKSVPFPKDEEKRDTHTKSKAKTKIDKGGKAMVL